MRERDAAMGPGGLYRTDDDVERAVGWRFERGGVASAASKCRVKLLRQWVDGRASYASRERGPRSARASCD